VPSTATRDHEEIKQWARERGACPAVVSRTGGMLRFEFDPKRAETLTEVDWNEFFRVFDEKGLELLYDEKPGSRFHKFVYPETMEAKRERRPAAKPARAQKRLQIIGGSEAGGRRAGRVAAGSARTKSATASRRATTPARTGSRGTGSAKTAAGVSRAAGGSRSSRVVNARASSVPRKNRAAQAAGKASRTRAKAGGARRGAARGGTRAVARTAGRRTGSRRAA
jgi:hypothetical protein